MTKINLLFLFLLYQTVALQAQDRIITRQGQISFFSYTSVENIEASNNQVYSLVDIPSKGIAVSMLMRAFVFKKALMEEHFNESYVESDIYPRLNFEGNLENFDIESKEAQTLIVRGILDFHGVKKEVSIKVKIELLQNRYLFSGNFDIAIDDYNIKVPPLLAPNIAKSITIKFRFEYEPYEKN